MIDIVVSNGLTFQVQSQEPQFLLLHYQDGLKSLSTLNNLLLVVAKGRAFAYPQPSDQSVRDFPKQYWWYQAEEEDDET